MKQYRNGVIVAVVLLAGFFLWKGLHKGSSRKGEGLAATSSASSSKSKTTVMASESPETEGSANPSPGNRPANGADYFPQDSIHAKFHLSRLKVRRDETPFPMSNNDLRPSTLWEKNDWKVWKGVSAIPLKNFKGDEGTRLGEIAHYVVVQTGATVDEHNFSASSPLMVFNSSSNRPGVVTGAYQITLDDAQDMQSLVLDYNLKIIAAVPAAKILIVTSNKEPFDLQVLWDALKKDARINSVNLAIESTSHGI